MFLVIIFVLCVIRLILEKYQLTAAVCISSHQLQQQLVYVSNVVQFPEIELANCVRFSLSVIVFEQTLFHQQHYYLF